ncbi:MAG: hypothetical protein ABI411_04545 [Tahibacter sp.]
MTRILSKEVLEVLGEYVARDVAAGFLLPDEIIQSATDALEGEGDSAAMHIEATRLCGEAIAAHLAAQSTWPSVTDCDKLDRAFAELESMGIVARQNYSCCGTCGAAEIVDEMESAVDKGGAVEGYTFFHAQDAESAAEGHGLYLSYGSAERSEDSTLTVGHKIVATLGKYGLVPAWGWQFEQADCRAAGLEATARSRAVTIRSADAASRRSLVQGQGHS